MPLWGVAAGLVCHRRGPQTRGVLWTQLLEPRQYWQSLVGDDMQALAVVQNIRNMRALNDWGREC